MYENHRKSFYRDDQRDFDDDRYENRWSSDERAARSRYRGGRSESGLGNERSRYGYRAGYRDDEQAGQRSDNQSEYWRGSYARDQRGGFAHDPQHHQYGQGASNYGYGSGLPYGDGEGDSRYFTGQQGSWAQRSPYGAQGRAGFGADYRSHGYASRDEDEERGFWDRASDEVASWFGDEEAARRREDDHRGRGPKDYTRSDERIREDANDRLTDDYRVDASNITVTVEKGEVTLDGTIASRAEKRRAEDVVDRISGVKHVQNNLRVAVGNAAAGAQNNWTASGTTSAVEGGTTAGSTAAKLPATA